MVAAIPYTLGSFMAGANQEPAIPTSHPAFEEAENAVKDRIEKLMGMKGKKRICRKFFISV